jgi:NAD(P)-dependent dehydrogenase (short-subunit alcohol dehydrogenase family)
MPPSSNAPRRTLLLTGASRGIGHATAIRFSSAGWRVITLSRHAFPEVCPWGAGPEDHIEVDLGSHDDTVRAISEIRRRLENDELHALVNNAAISPKAPDGGRLGTINTDIETWTQVFHVNFFAPIMIARGLIEELKHAGRGLENHLRAVHGNQFVCERRGNPHQRRSARLAILILMVRRRVSAVSNHVAPLLHPGLHPSRRRLRGSSG